MDMIYAATLQQSLTWTSNSENNGMTELSKKTLPQPPLNMQVRSYSKGSLHPPNKHKINFDVAI